MAGQDAASLRHAAQLGQTYAQAANETGTPDSVTPCFTPGTMIATPGGDIAVEHLRPGDKVLTRDNGPQTIAWAGSKRISGRDLMAQAHLRPVLIRAGALGGGLPRQDMRVSPNHRVLVRSDMTALYFEDREVLVAAKHLINNRGIHALDCTGVIYLHLLFEAHQVIRSDGAWTESFQPADQSLRGIGNAQRQEILSLFPDLRRRAGQGQFRPARRVLRPQMPEFPGE